MRTELLALALLASCKGGSDQPAGRAITGADHGAPKTAPASPPLAAKEFFRLDAQPVTWCKAGASCEAKLVLTALGDYHVNDEYPTKLVIEPTPGVTVESTTFTPAGATGTMAVAFKVDKPGTTKIAGQFRLSVCNEDNCQIEGPKIAFDVTAN
jgi:hypothetical protein